MADPPADNQLDHGSRRALARSGRRGSLTVEIRTHCAHQSSAVGARSDFRGRDNRTVEFSLDVCAHAKEVSNHRQVTKLGGILKHSGQLHRVGVTRKLDETGAAIGVAGGERDAFDVMVGRFKPAREQYLLAMQALDAIPPRPKDAIRESVNALEAVLKIITGRKNVSLGDAASELVRDTTDWRNALGASLKSLYGYVSSVPGARHSSYIDAEVSTDEAALVVRICGAAIVYFIDEYSDER